MEKLVTSLFAVLLLVGVGNAKVASTQYERALINAAKEGNASQVRGLLEAGTDPNVTDEHGNTPLIYGAKESAAIVDMLLYAGADVNAKGENGITALINSFAVVGPEANTIRTRLLKAKPDVNAVAYISQGQWWYTGGGSCGELMVVFNKTPTKSAAPIYGSATALSFAVASDDISAVEMLLKNRADVNIALMHPVLFTAIYSKKPNSTKIVELLLNAGADPWQGGDWKANALTASQDSGNIVDRGRKQSLIKAAMASTKEQHKLDEKLHRAIEAGNLKKVKKLLEQGANPNGHYEERYFTPLIKAANSDKEQSLEIMKTLIEAGADVNARNRSYSTALFCYSYGDKAYSEKTKLLLKAGADANVRNMYGRTPLFSAASEAAQILIDAGADVNARDYEGLSPLAFVYLSGGAEKKELLEKNGAKLTPQEKKRIALEQQKADLAVAEYRAKTAASGNTGLGQTLLQGLLNAANDTANFAIQNAGKF